MKACHYYYLQHVQQPSSDSGGGGGRGSDDEGKADVPNPMPKALGPTIHSLSLAALTMHAQDT